MSSNTDPYEALFQQSKEQKFANNYNPMMVTVFRLKEEHVRLAQRLNVIWFDDGEYSGIRVAHRRPFGNSYIADDIAEATEDSRLQYTWIGDGDDQEPEPLTQEQVHLCEQYYVEMVTVLQIMLQTGKLEEGLYMRMEPYKPWKATTERKVKLVEEFKEYRRFKQLRELQHRQEEAEEDCP